MGSEQQTTSMIQAGTELGQDFAAAVTLAVKRSNADNGAKREMARIVLREISRAVEELQATGVVQSMVDAYERACRGACREELLRQFPPEIGRAAA